MGCDMYLLVVTSKREDHWGTGAYLYVGRDPTLRYLLQDEEQPIPAALHGYSRYHAYGEFEADEWSYVHGWRTAGYITEAVEAAMQDPEWADEESLFWRPDPDARAALAYIRELPADTAIVLAQSC